MTSKISFSKMVISDIKRRVWLAAIIFLGFVLILPISGTLMIEAQLRHTRTAIQLAEVVSLVATWVGRSSFAIGLGVVSSAVICAFSGFKYLYSRKQQDVFHSIPVTRESVFLVQYVSGVCIFTVPFIVCEMLMLIICLVNGVLTGSVFASAVIGIGCHLVYFLLFYNIAILAIMLTGRMLVGVLGMLVFWSYIPFVYTIVSRCYSQYFSAYYQGGFGNSWRDGVVYLSPVSLYILQGSRNEIDSSVQYAEKVLSSQAWIMVISLVLLILTFGIAIWLYRKRASEAAEHSMAFAKSKPIIKVLLMIPISLGISLFLSTVSSGRSDGWMIFGLLFGLLVSQCLIEVIYTYDIKKVITHRKSLCVSAVCAILILSIFRFDIFGYDTYQPKQNKVKSVGISIDALENGISHVESYKGRYEYVNTTEYCLDNAKIEDISPVYEIVSERINNGESGEGDEQRIGVTTVTVCYNMNSGKKIYRSYPVKLANIREQVEAIYAEQGYKEGLYQILTMDFNDVGKLYVEDAYGDMNVSVSKDSYQELMEAYKADLAKTQLEDWWKADQVGTITFEMIDEREERYNFPLSYPIYPTNTQTLAQLEKLGYVLQGKVKLEDVQSVVVTNYATDEEYVEYSEAIDYRNIEYQNEIMYLSEQKITDKSEIQEILNSITKRGGYQDNLDHAWGISIEMKNRVGDIHMEDYVFLEGKVPDSVKEKFK